MENNNHSSSYSMNIDDDGSADENWPDDEDDVASDSDENWDDFAYDHKNLSTHIKSTNTTSLSTNYNINSEDPLPLKKKSFFEQSYLCYPVSHIGKSDSGNRIIMPQSALDRLATFNIEYPMMFEIKSHFFHQPISHCGVLEFTAEEGFVFMPSWMMKNLELEREELVKLKSCQLPKGTYMKLQPHKTGFLKLSNPKQVIEKGLINYACLTTGDTFMISDDNGIEYLFDVLETEPGNAISVVETDCVLDFEEPLDYKQEQEEEERRKLAVAAAEKAKGSQQNAIKEEIKFKAFTGASRKLAFTQKGRRLA